MQAQARVTPAPIVNRYCIGIARSVLTASKSKALRWLRVVATCGAVSTSAGALADYRQTAYPIVYDGDSVTAPISIQSWTNFEPLSGRYRPVVNPGEPTRLDAQRLRFDVPGEYYLLLNGVRPWRVLVLAQDESLSD